MKGPSRDMLIAKKSMLESELNALASMVQFNKHNEGQANKTLKSLKSKLNQSTESKKNKIAGVITRMTGCMSDLVTGSSREGNTSNCEIFKQANSDAVTATFQQAQLKLEYENAAFLLNSKGQFNDFLTIRTEALQRQIQSIEADLNESKPFLGGVADSREFRYLNTILNETEQNLDDAWTAFEYDSDSSHIHTDQETFSLNVATGISIPLPTPDAGTLLKFKGSANFGIGTADLKQALNSASLKVSGEVLRVVIKRPWFRPNIFTDPSLSFVQRDETQQKNTYVSPGPKTEKDLQDAIGGQGSSLYLLPEYASSFVLARGITLEFSGIDANTVSHSMQVMAGMTNSLSAAVGIFSMATSIGIGMTKQSVTVDRTANGMIINIPGAQVIGYCTEVLPRFPLTQI